MQKTVLIVLMLVLTSCSEKQDKSSAIPAAQVTAKTGTYAISPQFEEAEDFSEGLASVKVGGEDGKWGFIDKTGKMVINPQFDEVRYFSERQKQPGSGLSI